MKARPGPGRIAAALTMKASGQRDHLAGVDRAGDAIGLLRRGTDLRLEGAKKASKIACNAPSAGSGILYAACSLAYTALLHSDQV